MNPLDFMDTVYLGDRGIKGVIIDSWNDIVKIHINEISRDRSTNGNWNFYNDENVENGKLVFAQCSFFAITPSGAIPNDFIELGDFTALDGNNYQLEFITAGRLREQQLVQIKIQIICQEVHIETPDGTIIKE